ncbi:MAG: DUF420 domain-containing protein [Planctomycetota bacterium]
MTLSTLGSIGLLSTPPLLAAAHPIVHVNAGLNTLATLCLIAGWVLIKRGKERAHQKAMAGALAASVAFLACYLYYHFVVNLTVKFTHEGPVKYVYWAILLSHVLLAMTVPFFALAAAYYGWRALEGPAEQSPRMRARHRAVVRFGYPIWLYVSVTGVVVYAMLYHLWPSAEI